MDQDNTITAIFGEVIDRFTRAQAIADGSLVDATELARQAGFSVPVALTSAVWHDCVAWTDEDTENTGAPQDETGRLWDIVWVARVRCSGPAGRDTDRVRFTILRVARDAKVATPTPVRLDAHIGGGDDGEPVVTIMFPEES